MHGACIPISVSTSWSASSPTTSMDRRIAGTFSRLQEQREAAGLVLMSAVGPYGVSVWQGEIVVVLKTGDRAF